MATVPASVVPTLTRLRAVQRQYTGGLLTASDVEWCVREVLHDSDKAHTEESVQACVSLILEYAL